MSVAWAAALGEAVNRNCHFAGLTDLQVAAALGITAAEAKTCIEHWDNARPDTLRTELRRRLAQWLAENRETEKKDEPELVTV